MTFGETLREARLYRELSYTELSVKIKGDKTAKSYSRYLSQVEHEKIRPSYEIIAMFAEALEVDLYYRPGIGWGWRPAKGQR